MTLFSGCVPAGSIYSTVVSEVKLTLYIHMVWNDVVFRLWACWGVFLVQWWQKLSWHPINKWCEMTFSSGLCLLESIYSIVMSKVKLTPYIHMVWNDLVFRLVPAREYLYYSGVRSLVDTLYTHGVKWHCFLVVWLLGSNYSTVMSEVKLYTHGMKWRCFQVGCLLGSIYSIVVSEVKFDTLYTHGVKWPCFQAVCLLGSNYSIVVS